MVIISLNGIERIGKQYYSGILNNYLKEIYGFPRIKKFSFPSFTTQTGQKLAAQIKRFKAQDLVKPSSVTRSRYKKIAELMLANYEEYYRHIEIHDLIDNNISIINNNYFSVIAHWMATGLEYKAIKNILDTKPFLTQNNMLAIFLVSNDVKKVLTQPPKTHEYVNDSNIVISEDYINFFKQVDSYYRQIYITCTFSNIKTALIEVNMDIGYVTNTIAVIKDKVNSFLKSSNPIVAAVNEK